MDKYLEATLAGWVVIRLADVHITAPVVERLVNFVVSRTQSEAL